MAIRLLLTLFALWVVPVPAAEATDPALAEISAQLSSSAVLRGQFQQSKQIEGFRNPLRSSGRLVMAREHGVIWETQSPFPSTIVLSQDQLLSVDTQGNAKVLLSGADSGAMGAVHGLLMALIVGDFAQLSAQFAIEVQPSDQGWALLLTPTDPALQQAFAQIELSGDEFVRQVRMRESSGDRSVIDFGELQTLPEQLSAAEAQLFD